jgi:hypothetical protein
MHMRVVCEMRVCGCVCSAVLWLVDGFYFGLATGDDGQRLVHIHSPKHRKTAAIQATLSALIAAPRHSGSHGAKWNSNASQNPGFGGIEQTKRTAR